MARNDRLNFFRNLSATRRARAIIRYRAARSAALLELDDLLDGERRAEVARRAARKAAILAALQGR